MGEIGGDTRGIDDIVQGKLVDVGARLEEERERLQKYIMVRCDN